MITNPAQETRVRFPVEEIFFLLFCSSKERLVAFFLVQNKSLSLCITLHDASEEE
jgi:hypothetical protein